MTMSETPGPSESAVAIARTWLLVAGGLWLILAVGTLLAEGLGAIAAIFLVLAIAHVLLAKFASERCAVFLSLLGVP